MEKYDLIVIGGGPGGYPLAIRAAKIGMKVALIEEDNLGGTCLNRGCIPTKALLASAHIWRTLKTCSTQGFSFENPKFSWEFIQRRKDEIVQKLRLGIEKIFDRLGISLIKGTGIFFPDKPNLVIVRDKWEGEAKKVCFAVGSVPFVPSNFPIDRDKIWTSNEAIFTQKVPETLAIIGGGVIGLELGQLFAEFGSKVTIIEMMPQILPGLDSATAKRLLPVFKKIGIEIYLENKVNSIRVVDNEVEIHFGDSTRRFEKTLLSMGRRTNFSVIENKIDKIKTLEGRFSVDENYQTSIPNVFAIGDCIPGPMLAHRASYDAMVLSEQWTGKPIKPDYRFVPNCVYTFPSIAWVGMNEDQLQKESVAYKIGRSTFASNGKALASGETEGQIKNLVSPDGKLLGSIIWGPNADMLIMEPTILMQQQINLKNFQSVIHPHPTLSEAFSEACDAVIGISVHN